jgi:hypothetical protein
MSPPCGRAVVHLRPRPWNPPRRDRSSDRHAGPYGWVPPRESCAGGRLGDVRRRIRFRLDRGVLHRLQMNAEAGAALPSATERASRAHERIEEGRFRDFDPFVQPGKHAAGDSTTVRRARKRPKELVGGPASRLAAAPNKSGVVALRPGPSLGGLAAIEPGSRDRPEDRSPVRSGGSHLPLRARRNVLSATGLPQPPYPRTSDEPPERYPRLSRRCGRNVDGSACSIRARSAKRRFHRLEVGRWHDC